MKVLLRQSGGGIPPFVYYEPFSYAGGVESSAALAGGSSSDSESKLTDKDLFTMLKEMKGLPSDISEIMRTLSRVFAGDSLFANGSIDTSNLSNLYLKALHKMKIAEFNQKYYDEARKEVIDKGGLSEVAITDHGHIVVADEDGKITNVSVEELYENLDKYTPITNSDLFHIRAHNKSFDNTIIKMAQNGVGMNYVNEEIRKYLNDIGTNEVSLSGYSRTKNRQILEGIEYLQIAVRNGADLNGMNMDGVYKSKILTKDQQSKAKIAINHIWEDGLDNPSKTLLKYKGGGEEGGKAILARYVLSSLDSTINFDVDAVKDPLDVANGSDGSDSSKLKLNVAEQFLKGYGAKETFILSNGTSDGISVTGNKLPIINENGNPIINTTLQKVAESLYSGILDTENITMGDKHIDPRALDMVVFESQARRIDLPIDMNVYERTGLIRPDLDLLNRLHDAQVEIRESGVENNKQKVNEIFTKHQLPFMYTESGELNTTNWRTFMVLSGSALDKAFDDDGLNVTSFLLEIDDRDDIDKVLNLIRGNSSYNEKNLKFDASSILGIYGTKDHMFEGNIFIPLTINLFNAKAGSNQLLTPEQGIELETKLQRLDDITRKQQNFVRRSPLE